MNKYWYPIAGMLHSYCSSLRTHIYKFRNSIHNRLGSLWRYNFELGKHIENLADRKDRFCCKYNHMCSDPEHNLLHKISDIYMNKIVSPNIAIGYIVCSKLAYIDMCLDLVLFPKDRIHDICKYNLPDPSIPSGYRFCCKWAYIGKW